MNYYQMQQFVYKNFVMENVFLMVSGIKEFIFKNQNQAKSIWLEAIRK